MDNLENELMKAIAVITKNGCGCTEGNCDACPLYTDETQKEVDLCTAIQAFNK